MEDEGLLARWSRLKRTAARTDSAAAPTAPAVVSGGNAVVSDSSSAAIVDLPSIEALDFASDFSAFLQPRIEEGLRRAALKKLFHSEHFNQMDGLDVYIDDYNAFEPIPEDMLRNLTQARDLLFRDQPQAAEPPDGLVAESPSSAEAPAPEDLSAAAPAEADYAAAATTRQS